MKSRTKEELLKEVDRLEAEVRMLQAKYFDANKRTNFMEEERDKHWLEAKEVQQAHEILDILPNVPVKNYAGSSFTDWTKPIGWKHPKLTLSQRIVGFAIEALRPRDISPSPRMPIFEDKTKDVE